MVVLVLAAAVLAGVAGGAPPAAAETRLEVDAGYAGGSYLPGRAVPVRVRIEADRLIRSTLEVQVDLPGRSVPVAVPVEVPGGSDKEYLVVLPTLAGDDTAHVTARLRGDDAVVGEADLAFTGDTELVGLLPGLAPTVPGPQPLPHDLGTARFHELGDDELAAPGALEALGTVVTGPDGLGPLGGAARTNVLTWLDDGGRLVVDASPGDRVAGLPDAWQPGDGGRHAAGRGEVRLAEGAVAAGRWSEVVEPTPLVQPGEMDDTGLFFGSGEGVGATIAADGGLRVPRLGWLVAFLVAYVLLVGPVIFLVLRHRGRPAWAWWVVPGVAVVFSAGAFGVGSDLRAGNEAAHGSAVETGPAGARASSYVGLLSRSGQDAQVRFPAGWQSSGIAAPAFNEAGLTRLTSGPTRVVVQGDGTVGEVELDPGGFGLLSGWGAIEATPGLEVTAVAAPDGAVDGTIRNTTGLRLRDILIMVGMRSWGGGTLEPGESAEWHLDPDGGLSEHTWNGLAETPWIDATDWNGPRQEGAAVSFELWAAWRDRHADPFPSGLVVAAGWTDGWTPPVDSGREVRGGRTVFTTHAEVTTAEPGTVPPDAVRREHLRADRSAPADLDPEVVAARGEVSSAVVRFTLPAGALASRRLVLDVPDPVVRTEVLVGGRWVELPGAVEGPDAGRDPARDPAQPAADLRAGSVVEVPAAAVDDGSVYMRVAHDRATFSPLWGLTLRQAADP